jgi:hypothetical protein
MVVQAENDMGLQLKNTQIHCVAKWIGNVQFACGERSRCATGAMSEIDRQDLPICLGIFSAGKSPFTSDYPFLPHVPVILFPFSNRRPCCPCLPYPPPSLCVPNLYYDLIVASQQRSIFTSCHREWYQKGLFWWQERTWK